MSGIVKSKLERDRVKGRGPGSVAVGRGKVIPYLTLSGLGMNSFLGWDTSQRLLLFRLAATGQSYMTRKLSMPTKCILEICALNS